MWKPGLLAFQRVVAQQDRPLGSGGFQLLCQPGYLLIGDAAAAVALRGGVQDQKAVAADLIFAVVAAGAVFAQITAVEAGLEVVISQHGDHRDSAAFPFNELAQILIVFHRSFVYQIAGQDDQVGLGCHGLPQTGEKVLYRGNGLAQRLPIQHGTVIVPQNVEI